MKFPEEYILQLLSVRLRRYRSIEEMDPFPIEPDVTCLVGKNESGKTAVLQAMHKSYSFDGSRFDEGLDYPTTKTRERRKTEGKIEVAQLTYELDEDDISAVEMDLGKGALLSNKITVRSFYRSGNIWTVQLDENIVTRHLASTLDLPTKSQEAVQGATTISGLVDILDNLEDENSSAKKVLDTVNAWRKSNPRLRAIDILDKRLPRFVYFGEYDSMPGEIKIKELISAQNSGELSRGQKAFISLLHLAGVEPEDFIDPESQEHLIRDVENASNGITEEVFRYWSQNTNLRVVLQMGQGSYEGESTPTIQIRVLNQKHNVSVPFDERSRGFVWFFSFLAYFSEIEEESDFPLILLLDEPGLSLHAKAQADLLRFIEEKLTSQHQVLFTTHSPFMVDPQKLERVRTVEDRTEVGTQVFDDVLRADNDTVFPLMAAMGVDLTQTLWVGPNVLLVEGPADVVYLNHLSHELYTRGRIGLDERWTLTPAGGITKLPAFLSLFGANKMNLAVVTDSSPKDQDTIRRLEELGRLNSIGIIQIGDITGAKEADLEDLFDPHYYVNLVNQAYSGMLKDSPIDPANLPHHVRLVRRVEEYFKTNMINNGRFNHYAPAGVLTRVRESQVALDPETLDQAEVLFEKINELLPS